MWAIKKNVFMIGKDTTHDFIIALIIIIERIDLLSVILEKLSNLSFGINWALFGKKLIVYLLCVN